MDMTTQIQILQKNVCISHSTNTLGKGMNLNILHSAMGRFGSLTLIWQKKKEKSNFNPAKLLLKVYLESNPVHGEGLVNKYSLL